MDVYEQLEDMLLSKEVGNISLAMELMANSNYKMSEVKIALLMNRHWNIMSNSKTWQLTNFKSVLTYIDNKFNPRDRNPVAFAENIIKTTKEDMPDSIERIELARDSVKKYLDQTLNSKIFKIKELLINA